jgi:hypothetical protein
MGRDAVHVVHLGVPGETAGFEVPGPNAKVGRPYGQPESLPEAAQVLFGRDAAPNILNLGKEAFSLPGVVSQQRHIELDMNELTRLVGVALVDAKCIAVAIQ